MNLSKDAYEYILNFADDRTILNMLSVNEKFNDDDLFKRIMKRKYPHLIDYKQDGETWKHLFVRIVYYIAKLEEDFGVIDISNPINKYFYIKELFYDERLNFVIRTQNEPFGIDINSGILKRIRNKIVAAGVKKMIPYENLPRRAEAVWDILNDMGIFYSKPILTEDEYVEASKRLKEIDMNFM